MSTMLVRVNQCVDFYSKAQLMLPTLTSKNKNTNSLSNIGRKIKPKFQEVLFEIITLIDVINNTYWNESWKMRWLTS